MALRGVYVCVEASAVMGHASMPTSTQQGFRASAGFRSAIGTAVVVAAAVTTAAVATSTTVTEGLFSGALLRTTRGGGGKLARKPFALEEGYDTRKVCARLRDSTIALLFPIAIVLPLRCVAKMKRECKDLCNATWKVKPCMLDEQWQHGAENRPQESAQLKHKFLFV